MTFAGFWNGFTLGIKGDSVGEETKMSVLQKSL